MFPALIFSGAKKCWNTVWSLAKYTKFSNIDKSAPLQEKEVCPWPCGISYPQALPWVLTYKCDPKFIAISHLSLIKYLNWVSISDLSSLQSYVKCHLHRRNLVMLMPLTRIFITEKQNKQTKKSLNVLFHQFCFWKLMIFLYKNIESKSAPKIFLLCLKSKTFLLLKYRFFLLSIHIYTNFIVNRK